MSSGGYGRYESAEAREARLMRGALLDWQVACAERDALAMRSRQESAVRGSIGVTVGRPDRASVNGKAASEIVTATATLRNETNILTQKVKEGIESRSRKNAAEYIARSVLPDIPVVDEAPRTTAPAFQEAAPALDHTRLDEAIRAELARAVDEAVDLDGFGEIVDSIRKGATQAHALFAVGRLREAVGIAIAEQHRLTRRREELEAELNRASALFMIDTGNPDLPIADLEEARQSVSTGEHVADHILRRISAAANRVEDEALAALRALNTSTSTAIVLEAFAARGYHPVELAQVLVVEDGQLVSRGAEHLLGRDDEPDHAIRVRVHNGEVEVQEVRIATSRGDDPKSDDRRFEQKMCAAVEDVKDDVRQRGMEFDISLGNVSIPTMSTAGKAKKSRPLLTVIDEHQKHGEQRERRR